MGEAKLLIETAISINISSNLLVYIRLTAINFASHCGAKMSQTLNPWERIPTKEHTRKMSWSHQERHALRLTLLGIRICGEL